LRDVLRITPQEARRRIDHAHAVTDAPLVSGGTVAAPLPVTGAAARDGVLGPDHVDVIARALTGLPPQVGPDAIAEAERTMVTAAASMDARRIACDCKVIPALLGAGSEPLDVGRVSCTVPSAPCRPRCAVP